MEISTINLSQNRAALIYGKFKWGKLSLDPVEPVAVWSQALQHEPVPQTIPNQSV